MERTRPCAAGCAAGLRGDLPQNHRVVLWVPVIPVEVDHLLTGGDNSTSTELNVRRNSVNDAPVT